MPDSSVTESRVLQGLQRYAQGEVAVLDELIDYTGRRLRLLARRMLNEFSGVRRWEQTDDVLQSAMMRLLRALQDVQPTSVRDFLSLATLQIRRELLDLARHYFGPQGAGANHASWPAGDDPQATHVDRSDVTLEPSRLAEWREFHEQVQRLPGEQREVVSLLYYQGLTQAAAAAVLGVTVRTVQRRWQSALLALHRRLKGEHPGDDV
ncbi:MAG: sigma-70 family RNA polymerase sigma factor [Planctomycetaceae bacterium]